MAESKIKSLYSGNLTERLAQRIRREGPISFAEWMRAALYDDEGYYNRHVQRWGREGDYRTSPERSELFAATFARYFAKLFLELGQPDNWTIVECGAGDGSFAEGVLGTLRNYFPDVYDVTRYYIDEVSNSAVQRIQSRLIRFRDHFEFRRLNSVESLDPGVVFSNELLDAFPVHRLTRRNHELLEFYVTLNNEGRFDWCIASPCDARLAAYCDDNGIDIEDGQTIEISLEIDRWLSLVAAKLKKGYIVTVDYGAEQSDLYSFEERPQGTLRGYSRHAAVEILENPGQHDITSTINWTHVRRVSEALGLETIAFENQDKFLIDAGILDELQLRLKDAGSDARRLQLTTSAREMILPGGMSSSFQVLVQKKTVEAVAT